MKKTNFKKEKKFFLKIIKASQYHNVDMEKLKSLDVKSFINVTDMNRRTPIHFALKNLDVLKFLIENGADVNAANIWYLTPLMVAKKHLKKVMEYKKYKDTQDYQDYLDTGEVSSLYKSLDALKEKIQHDEEKVVQQNDIIDLLIKHGAK